MPMLAYYQYHRTICFFCFKSKIHCTVDLSKIKAQHLLVYVYFSNSMSQGILVFLIGYIFRFFTAIPFLDWCLYWSLQFSLSTLFSNAAQFNFSSIQSYISISSYISDRLWSSKMLHKNEYTYVLMPLRTGFY